MAWKRGDRKLLERGDVSVELACSHYSLDIDIVGDRVLASERFCVLQSSCMHP